MSLRQHIESIVPNALVQDKRLCDLSIRIYLTLQRNRFKSISELAPAVGASRARTGRAVEVLTERGWAFCIDSEDSRGKVVVPTWPLSVEERIAALIADDKESVAFLGQWLMWDWLDVLVDALDYLDNSRPDWLRNADTGYRMELDREYRSLGVAFEFQGEQHFRPTQAYPDEDAQARQQLRDDQKVGVCLRNGVRLVEVTFEDLTFKGMLRKVDGLPLRHYRPDGPIIRTLGQYSDSYIARMRRKKAGAK